MVVVAGPSAPALSSRLTERVELVSECLSVLQDLVPQLSAEEQVLVATQHPFATPAWLNSLVALSQGQLTEDLLLIVDLERELANCQMLATTRMHQARSWRAAEAADDRNVLGAGLAAVGRSEAGAAPPVPAKAARDESPLLSGRAAAPTMGRPTGQLAGVASSRRSPASTRDTSGAQQRVARRASSPEPEEETEEQLEEAVDADEEDEVVEAEYLEGEAEEEAPALSRGASGEEEEALDEEQELQRRRASYEMLGEGECEEGQRVETPPSARLEDGTPSASLDHLKAWGTPTRCSRAPPQQLGGPRWPPGSPPAAPIDGEDVPPFLPPGGRRRHRRGAAAAAAGGRRLQLDLGRDQGAQRRDHQRAVHRRRGGQPGALPLLRAPVRAGPAGEAHGNLPGDQEECSKPWRAAKGDKALALLSCAR